MTVLSSINNFNHVFLHCNGNTDILMTHVCSNLDLNFFSEDFFELYIIFNVFIELKFKIPLVIKIQFT